MNPILKELIELLALERLEDDLFRGDSRDIGYKRVYGGQVLGQALSAARSTVENRYIHSLHAYFLREGDPEHPIVYFVDRARDGRSFSARRVTAIQHGKQIFNMACSFQSDEQGLEHQTRMPEVPPPEELKDMREYGEKISQEMPWKIRRILTRRRPFEIRPVEVTNPVSPEKREPVHNYWFKAVDNLPDDRELHDILLAYVSDYSLLPTATLPHGISFLDPRVQMASLDHAMYFHRPVRVDEWLLYSMESPNLANNRGLARGQVFSRDGRLLASTVQEGVIRVWDEPDA